MLDTYTEVLLRLDRVDQARPFVVRLVSAGFRDQEFLDLCRQKGLGELVERTPTEGEK